MKSLEISSGVELPERLRQYHGSPDTALHTDVLSHDQTSFHGEVAERSEVDRCVEHTSAMTVESRCSRTNGFSGQSYGGDAQHAKGWSVRLKRNGDGGLRPKGEPVTFLVTAIVPLTQATWLGARRCSSHRRVPF